MWNSSIDMEILNRFFFFFLSYFYPGLEKSLPKIPCNWTLYVLTLVKILAGKFTYILLRELCIGKKKIRPINCEYGNVFKDTVSHNCIQLKKLLSRHDNLFSSSLNAVSKRVWVQPESLRQWTKSKSPKHQSW